MAVLLHGDYDEVFKFKEWGSRDSHIWLMEETIEYVKDEEARGKVVKSIEYDNSNKQYILFRITYL